METNPVIVHRAKKRKVEKTATHPLVRSIDWVLDEVIDTCTNPSIEQCFNFLSEQLACCQTRKTVPVALLSHDPLSLTSSEVFSRVEQFAEKCVRRPNTKLAYLRDLHCNKKTEKVTEILATAFETASLVYLNDFETYYIALQNYEAWDKQVITNVFESLHDLLQDANIRVGVFIEIAGDASVFRAAMDYNIVFGLDIRELSLPCFSSIKEMVFLMLMSVQGFPALSAALAKEVFAAPSLSDVRKMLKFHVIRHFMSAGMLGNQQFEDMYKCLRDLDAPSRLGPAATLLEAKSGWIQAFGKLNVLLLSLQVPTETRLLSVYCNSDFREVLPITDLHKCLERIGSEEQWSDTLSHIIETNSKIGERLQFLYLQSQERKKGCSDRSIDVARARDSLDLFLASEERMETALDAQDIEEMKAALPGYLRENPDVVKPKQSRKDALLNRPMAEDARFEKFKKTRLRECVQRLFEAPLQHPELVIRERCSKDHSMVLIDVVSDSPSGQNSFTSPFLKSTVDLASDIAQHLFYPHVYLGCPRLEKRVNPDVSIIFHLISRSGKRVDISDAFDEYCGIVGREDIPLAQSRFLRALGELKLLGVVKESKRKAKDERIFIEKLLFAKSTSLN